jgi:hypothetical protein
MIFRGIGSIGIKVENSQYGFSSREFRGAGSID